MPLPVVRRLLAGVVLLAAGHAAPAQVAAPPASGKYWVYLGTYTGKGGSRGIYRCELDAATGKLTAPELAAEVGNPSFLTLSPDGKTLYAVGEVANAGGKKNEGGVYAYRVDPATGGLTKLNEATSGGAGPCHVSTDPAGDAVLVANYGGGSWALFAAGEDGRLAGRVGGATAAGTGPNKQRQDRPHCHCGAFDSSGNHTFVVDLGTDSVYVNRYHFVKAGGAPAVVTEGLPPVKLPAGSGPRHIALTPANDWAFVNGELDSTVNVVRMDLAAGKFEVVQSLSTLPGGNPVKGNSTAEVRIHPSGRFVYVSNRGHNSIAAFAWDGSKLTPIGHATEGVKTPRNFNLDPTGRWLLVANQDGDSVAVFGVDPATGLPKPTGHTIAVGKPVCVKFLAKP